MFYLSQELFFPPVSETKSHGIVALEETCLERLQLAYKAVFSRGLKMVSLYLVVT
jgi:leucyl/phenylalanyl-tRNA--protein transferase